MLTARSGDQLEEIAHQLRSSDRVVATAAIDLTNSSDINSAIANLMSEGEPPSVLINNAGAAYTGDLLAMPLERWQWLLQLNLTSVMQVCSAVVPSMRSQGGLVINVSSHAARNAFPQWGAYCITKAALASFTRCLAEEERDQGIRACTLTLGAVNTPLWDAETVQSDFDRRAMLNVDQAADALVNLAEQPSNQVIEDLTLMPAAGAF
jgi:short-subunit dehydrogenase